MIRVEPAAAQPPTCLETCRNTIYEIANKIRSFVFSIWGGVLLLTGAAAMVFGLKTAAIAGAVFSIAAFAVESVRSQNQIEFDDRSWAREYANADEQGKRAMNAELFQNTLEAIERGVWVDSAQHEAMMAGVRNVAQMPEGPARGPAIPMADWVEVHNTTTYATLCRVAQQGYNPLVLDMANAVTKGGGVLNGALAQEETLCRQSDLYSGLEEAERLGGYPIPVHGGILVPGVQFFRDDADQGYAFRAPITADVFVSAAFNSNRRHGLGYDRPADEAVYEAGMKEKMRTMFRMAIQNGNDSLLLSAFGCGAFRNIPEHVARFYREVLLEPEFAGAFRKVFFGIYDPPGIQHQNAPVFQEILR